MIKQLYLLLLVELMVANCTAQTIFTKSWDHRFGGPKTENVHGLIHTSDGGFLINGASTSCQGCDISDANRDSLCLTSDYWVVKTDSNGIKLWDKRYGGRAGEASRSIIQTFDGGYLLGGYTESDKGADKSEPSRGSGDYWIVKIDSVGNLKWDKGLGGSGYDELAQVIQTRDGGYFLGGDSESDSSGDKTQHIINHQDYWVIRTDSFGRRIWDKTFGTFGSDVLYSVIECDDGGFLLFGASSQGLSNDKHCIGYGSLDYWLIKIDSLGNEVWDNCYGGSGFDTPSRIIATSDKGFLMGGVSSSPVSGTKSQPINGNWARDLWIVKIDSLGNQLWDRDYGGFNHEEILSDLKLLPDGGFLISSASESDSSGDKTENRLGTTQSWIVRTDSIGNILWDKTMFTYGGFPWTAGCFSVFVGGDEYVTASSENGDIGGYKTDFNWDVTDSTNDYWLIKYTCFNPTTEINTITSVNDFQIFPNPSTDQISILIPSPGPKFQEIQIYDMVGKLVFRNRFENLGNAISIDVSNFENGIYQLSLKNGTFTSNRKFVKL